MGLNQEEACLKFTDGGHMKYYGGGAQVYANKEEVITAFYALCWISRRFDNMQVLGRVEQVAKRWLDRSGNVIR